MNTLTKTHKTGFAPLPQGTRELSAHEAALVSGGGLPALGPIVVAAARASLQVAKRAARTAGRAARRGASVGAGGVIGGFGGAAGVDGYTAFKGWLAKTRGGH